MESQRSFSVREYAQRHSVSNATVFRWLRSGKLDSIKVGRLRRITLEDENAFLEKFRENDSGMEGQKNA